MRLCMLMPPSQDGILAHGLDSHVEEKLSHFSPLVMAQATAYQSMITDAEGFSPGPRQSDCRGGSRNDAWNW